MCCRQTTHRQPDSQMVQGWQRGQTKEEKVSPREGSAKVQEEGQGDEESLSCQEAGCEFRTRSRAKLDRHAVRHTGALCPVCGLGFRLTKQLRAHMAAVHHKERTAASGPVCHVCKASFNTPRQLRLHTDSVHGKKRSFLCSECGYSAGSRSALKLHTRKHTGEKPFVCEECDFTTSDHNSFRRHKMRHSGVSL